MQRGFFLALIVILAIFVGVILAVQKTNHPLMLQFVKEQAEIIDSQHKIYQLLSANPALAGGMQAEDVRNVSGPASLGSILKEQLATQQKINELEKKMDAVLIVMQAGRVAGGAAQQQPPGPPPEEYTKVYDIDMANSPIRGKKDAPITITEFVDFQCPFCGRFHSVGQEVLKAYPDKVRYVLKNFPLQFHPQAKPGAKAALAAGQQGKYWEMVDAILENQGELSDQKFEELAKKIGLDVKKFLKDYKERDAEWEKIIQQDLQLGQKVEVRGTPTFYLNGRKTIARDLPGFQKEIDEILNKK